MLFLRVFFTLFMKDYSRLFDIIHYQKENHPLEKCFTTKYNNTWKSLSTNEVVDKVNRLSLALIDLGVQPGDKIAIISTNNRTEWNIVDLACLQVGAIDVPVYPTISPGEYEYIFNDAEVKYAFVSDEELFDKVDVIKDKVPSLKEIYSFDQVSGKKNWEELFELANDQHNEELEKRKSEVKPEDLATLIYTSGTTGKPKGVMLSHNNVVENTKATLKDLPLEPGMVVLSFLPLCHIFERMVIYSYLAAGVEIHYAESMESIGDNLKEVQPHFFTTVPRLLEKVYEKIVNKGLDLTGVKRALFFWAMDVGMEYNWRKEQGFFYNMKLNIANKLIFSKWREALGGRVQGIVSGSAPLQERLARIFSAAGIDVREGYGLTETSPVLTYNRFSKEGAMLGTVGLPLDNVQIKIAEDGEILCKGPNVMMGYYNQEEKTKEVFTEDGWFKTGDIGEMNEEGFLKITDRKKQLMKTSGGKYVAPQPIEEKFKESMLIEQMIVVAEQEKFVSALIVPSFSNLRDWCATNNIQCEENNEELVQNEKVLSKIQEIVDEANDNFSHVEQIKKFKLMPREFTIEDGELTPTLKLKRREILKNYEQEINSIYSR